MFDLFFDSAFALQYLMMIFGGLICLGLGGLFSADFVHWRLNAKRTRGRIVSFVEKAGSEQIFYHAVAEYTDHAGQIQKVTSDVGSGHLDERKLNKPVTILYFPEKQGKARILGSGWPIFIVGVVLIIVACVFFYFGAAHLKFNMVTLVVLTLLLGYAAFKISKIIKPKNEWESIAQFKARREKECLQKQEVRNSEMKELTPQDVKKKAQDIRAQHAKWSWLVLAIGMVFCGIGYYTGQDVWYLEQSGSAAQGRVVRIDSRTDSDGTTYYPVVRYKTDQGKKVTFKSNTGSNPPFYSVGDDVDVLYDAADPKERAMIDAGLWNWLLPSIFGGIGTVMCFIIFPSMRSRGNKTR